MIVDSVLTLGQFFYNLAYCFGYMCLNPIKDISTIDYVSPITNEYVTNDIVGIDALGTLVESLFGVDFTLLDVIGGLIVTTFLVALVMRIVDWFTA